MKRRTVQHAPVVVFDDELTRQCAQVSASVRIAPDEDYMVLADVQVFPSVRRGDANVHVELLFKRHFPQVGPNDNRDTAVKEILELSEHEVVPLAEALTRAVAAAQAKGFIPGTNAVEQEAQ